MGLFEKKTCVRCGKELGLIFGKVKIADGHICKDCNALLSPLLSGRGNLTLADIERHIAYREENKTALNCFNATTILGNEEKLYFDDAKSQFVYENYGDYIKNNADIFSLNQVVSAEVVKEESEEEIMQEGADGKKVSYDPKQYDYFASYKVKVVLRHPWVSGFTMDISEGDINKAETESIVEFENLAGNIVAKLTGTTYEEISVTEATETSENVWVCSNCGKENSNDVKFCPECGTARPVKNKFCPECGTKLETGVKFCPNCGKAVS